MLFNTAKIFDFQPTLKFDSGDQLEMVEETTLLGIKMQSNLKWGTNTNYICEKAYKRLWIIRRLKSLGATREELVDIYIKQVRCVLELAAPVWTAGLTMNQIAQLERVQKTVCSIILWDNYKGYENALEVLYMTTLSERRTELNLKFAKKCLVTNTNIGL